MLSKSFNKLEDNSFQKFKKVAVIFIANHNV